MCFLPECVYLFFFMLYILPYPFLICNLALRKYSVTMSGSCAVNSNDIPKKFYRIFIFSLPDFHLYLVNYSQKMISFSLYINYFGGTSVICVETNVKSN